MPRHGPLLVGGGETLRELASGLKAGRSRKDRQTTNAPRPPRDLASPPGRSPFWRVRFPATSLVELDARRELVVNQRRVVPLTDPRAVAHELGDVIEAHATLGEMTAE